MRRVVLESPYAARNPEMCPADWDAHYAYLVLLGSALQTDVDLKTAQDTWQTRDRDANVAYARQCLLDCLRRQEAPIASHLLITQVLDDLVPEERQTGIAAGIAWHDAADAIVFYTDRGWSRGMRYAHEYATAHGLTIEYRSLSGTPTTP